ncbi:hypothetical protein GCM10028811_29920 [Uliginosibacterium sediminicola]
MLESEERMVRVRAEEYENLFFTLLERIGHTDTRHNGIFDLYDLLDQLKQKHGEQFVTTLTKIQTQSLFSRLDNVGPIDPFPIIEAARKKLGPQGGLAMMEIFDMHQRINELSPYTSERYVQWDDVIPLDGLYERPSNKANHGEFIDQRFIDYLAANVAQLYEMHWRRFEELIAEYFHRIGYKVELGPGQNDDGVDIRVWRPEENGQGVGQLHIVQCKRQRDKIEKVVVKGLYADVMHENAAWGVIVTTSSLAKGAKKTIEARGYPIQEVDGNKVAEWLTTLRTPGTGIVRRSSS